MAKTPEQAWAVARSENKAAKPAVLGPALGLTPQAVSLWKRVPAERVLDVERVTGISRHDLRPDVFGPPANSSSRAPSDGPGAQPDATGEAVSSSPVASFLSGDAA